MFQIFFCFVHIIIPALQDYCRDCEADDDNSENNDGGDDCFMFDVSMLKMLLDRKCMQNSGF